MPSVSKSQWRMMELAAKSAKFAKKIGMRQDVAKEFHEEDLRLQKLDPTHYDSLPEKANEAQVSNEGTFAGLFPGFKLFADNTPHAPAKVPHYWELVAKYHHYTGPTTAKATHVALGKLSGHFHMDRAGHFLSDLESGVNEILKFYERFASTLHTAINKILKEYGKSKSLTPVKAVELCEKASADLRKTMHKIVPPGTAIGNIIVSENDDWYSMKHGPMAQLPAVLDMNDQVLKKLLSIAQTLAGKLDKFSDDLFDNVEHRDFKTEYRYWSNKYPADEHVWDKIFHEIPFNMEYGVYDDAQIYIEQLRKVLHGIDVLVIEATK